MRVPRSGASAHARPGSLEPVAGPLGVLMVTAFLDMVGGLIILPLLPFYAERLGANGVMITLLMSAFSAVQLLSAPVWGGVSDRYGRRPALLAGLGMSVAGYLLFATSGSYAGLVLARAVQGAGGGTTGVIQAYVADAVGPKDRARALGWLSAATNAGLVIGLLIGSMSAGGRGERPGLIAAALCLATAGFAWRFLPESHARESHAPASQPRGRQPPAGPTALQAVGRVATQPGAAPSRLILAYAVAMGAFYGITAVMVLLLQRRYAVTEATVGYFFAYMGVLSIVFRVGVLGRVVDAIGETRAARLGAALLAFGLAVVPFLRPVSLPGALALTPLALAVALHLLGAALLFPSVTALLTCVVGDGERGLYLGVQQTYGGLARVGYPLWAGFAWDRLGEGVAFWTSGALVAATLPLALGLGRLRRGVAGTAAERRAREEAAKEAATVVE